VAETVAGGQWRWRPAAVEARPRRGPRAGAGADPGPGSARQGAAHLGAGRPRSVCRGGGGG
jgi:hypothetical protein